MAYRVAYRRWISTLILAAAFAPAVLANNAEAQEVTQIPPQALPAAIDSLLDKGRSLEADMQWAAALSHYEDALRTHPRDTSLLKHYDLAKLQYSLARRNADDTFVRTAESLKTSEASAVFSAVLLKLQSHYVTMPAWRDLVYRGAKALDVALTNNDFLARNELSNIGSDRLVAFRRDLYNIARRHTIRNRSDAVTAVATIARFAQSRIGLSPSATFLEFSDAAAGGLDFYSAFLSSGQLKDVFSQIEGNFVGLGVELKADDGGLLIVNVIPRSPAERAGIRAGDTIVEVDGQSTVDLTTDQAATLLTGQEGSIAQLTAVTPGQTARRLTIRREHVEVPSIEDAKILDADTGIAYVKLPTFQKTTGRDLEAALWELYHQGMRSLILDLRGNPGGLPNGVGRSG